jgi:hypothetical protein
MKKLFAIVVAGCLLCSCASTQLYNWGGNYNSGNGVFSMYEQRAFTFYEKHSPESICELLCLYADMVNNPGGTRNVVPPGIYAEYGYLLLQPETAEAFENHATKKQKSVFNYTDYGASFYELGIAMMQKEIELYPESEKFIGPLINRMKRQ